jgi:hypothetical protein
MSELSPSKQRVMLQPLASTVKRGLSFSAGQEQIELSENRESTLGAKRKTATTLYFKTGHETSKFVKRQLRD